MASYLQPYHYGSTVEPCLEESPAVKLAVDRDVHAKVLNAAEEEGLSVSAWMPRSPRWPFNTKLTSISDDSDDIVRLLGAAGSTLSVAKV